MRDMAGGSYSRSLRSAFLPELLSLNFLIAGMIPVMTFAMKATPNSGFGQGWPAKWLMRNGPKTSSCAKQHFSDGVRTRTQKKCC
jgi:hypothetical protein